MTSLKEVDRNIRRLTREEKTCRPFMCDGSPIGCQVAQVGINPSTLTPFWPFWNTRQGCDKRGWLEEYIRLRGKLMPTRDRIEVLCQALMPLRCLELNLSHHYAKSEGELRPNQLADTAVFDYMLETIRPQVLVVHGKNPILHLERKLDVVVKKEEFISHMYRGAPVEIIAAKSHFSRGVSRDYVTDLGERIKNRVNELTSSGPTNR